MYVICRTPFFHIRTSKSGPRMVCFVHFDLQMCFSLQRRAIFAHPNFKKWSEHGASCTFWLDNLFLATAACNFRHLFKKWSKTVSFLTFWLWNVFLATAACNFRHLFKKWSKTVSFLTFWLWNAFLATAACNFSFLLWTATSAPAALANLLFDLPDPRIMGKTQHFATLLKFRAPVSFYWLYFLLTLLSSDSTFFWFCFSALLFIFPYCRKLDF